ncbi:sugar O-acetyltransferase [Halohasta litorea]|uniref:Sugar O-acetyltransferase n=1 Tax=Halohasta litorea TaxID=869891 RepID=A0ABD6D208_9EURY|nr:sugar O-acetyltransferase [Halohasta litorea]
MATEKAAMLNGKLYDPTDPELVEDRQRARDLTRRYNRTAADEADRRRELLDTLLGSRGECFIEPPFRCDYGYNIHVGDEVAVNFECVILDVCRVEIGDDCLIGPGVHIYTATHPIDPEERATGLEYGNPVEIGDNVWIGGHATINPGVTVGDDAVIGSGAVVTDDVPEGVVVGGNPATIIKEVDAAD